MTLIEFLEARITEDQVRATMRAWHAEGCDTIPDAEGYTYPCDCGVPERMSAECEAKRRIVEDCEAVIVLSDADDNGAQLAPAILAYLALPYVDHPDYYDPFEKP